MDDLRATKPAMLSPVHTNAHAARMPAWLAAVAIAASIALVYGRSLDVPFIFDDEPAIVRNSSIRAIWPPFGTFDAPGPLRPPPNQPTAARPLVNLTFAMNYWAGALNPVGYHLVNAIIHFLSALLLWAIVRRTLRLPRFNRQFDTAADWLALAAAMLWALHSLQTEAVVYATQRTELLMAFCYLATLYGSLRYWAATLGSRQRAVWLALATLACACGMASKEVMVSAPLIVLLFERAFISDSLAASIRRSWPLYACLAMTWLLLLALNVGAPREGSAGFSSDVPAAAWWLTQCKVLLIYLKLALWPAPLLLHYELPYLTTFAQAWLYVLPVVLLAAWAIVLLYRNKPLGFLLAAAAAILAPTFFIPIPTEMAAERRMYLPLAALVVVLVVGGYRIICTWLTPSSNMQLPESDKTALRAVVTMGTFLAIVFGFASASRLQHYHDELLLWQQVAQHQPANALAQYNLGLLLNHAGREPESRAALEAAVAARPDYADARSALGFALINAGRLPDAVAMLEAALKLEPDHVAALNNLGIASMRMGNNDAAIRHLQHALEINPKHADARHNLGRALAWAGKTADALTELQRAAELAPDDPFVLHDLGAMLAANGRVPQAIEVWQHTARAHPNLPLIHNSLAIALYDVGDVPGAIRHFAAVVKLQPANAGAYGNLANVLAAAGRTNEALAAVEQGIAAAGQAGDQATAAQLEQQLNALRAK